MTSVEELLQGGLKELQNVMTTIELLQDGLKELQNEMKVQKAAAAAGGRGRREFQGDSITKWLVGAILSLSVLEVLSKFFHSYTIACYVSSGNVSYSHDEMIYLNNYCYSSLPIVEYFTLYLVVHGALIVMPHILWKTWFDSSFTYLFDLVGKLDRLKDTKTGEYQQTNFDIIDRLEEELTHSHRWPPIFTWYCVKMVAQLLMAIGSLAFSYIVFHNFSDVFDCPKKNGEQEGWPLNHAIKCVYPSINFLLLLQYGDMILTLLIIIITIGAIIWCFWPKHSQLGTSAIAEFCIQSCVAPSDALYKCINGSRITSDLDFFVMMLYCSSSGRGQTFKDMQIFKKLKKLYSEENELHRLLVDHTWKREDWNAELPEGKYHLQAGFRHIIETFKFDSSPRNDVERQLKPDLGLSDEEDHTHASVGRKKRYSFQNYVYSFLSSMKRYRGRPGRTAVDISFNDTSGCAFILAWACETVCAINFHSQYHDDKEMVKQFVHYNQVTKLLFPENHFSLPSSADNKFDTYLDGVMFMSIPTANERMPRRKDHINDEDDNYINFFTVGPIEDDAKKVTVNLLLDKLHFRLDIGQGCLLLAIRPLKIAGTNVSTIYKRYIPPKNLFGLIDEETGAIVRSKGVQTMPLNEPAVRHRGGPAKAAPLEELPLLQENDQQDIMLSGDVLVSLSTDVPTRGTDQPSHSDDRAQHESIVMTSMPAISAEFEQQDGGVVCYCGDVECVFEMKVYVYVGTVPFD